MPHVIAPLQGNPSTAADGAAFGYYVAPCFIFMMELPQISIYYFFMISSNISIEFNSQPLLFVYKHALYYSYLNEQEGKVIRVYK